MASNGMSGADAIVVGAGLGGLSAAAYLAAVGKRVILLEKYSALGGSSHVFQRRGRWEFDCGVHYVGECGDDGAVTTVMRGLGLDDRIEWLPLDESGFDRIIGPGFELATPVGWDAYLTNLHKSFPDEPRAVRRFHSVMRKLGESVDRFDTAGSARGHGQWLIKAGTAAPFAAMPYGAFLAMCGFSGRAVLALSVQCGALATTPATVPTAMMAGFLQDYVGAGAYYPRGGGQMLAAGFAEVITTHGGQIRTHSDVSRIVIEGNAVVGVELADGQRVHAPVVVSDVDVIKTFTDLVGLDRLPAWHRNRVRRWKMSKPVVTGFFGLDYDTGAYPNSNFFSIPNWDDAGSLWSLSKMAGQLIGGRGFDDGAEWARALAARQPMYVQSSSRRDPSNGRAAPVGSSTVEVQTITPADPRLWGVHGYDIDSGEYRGDARYSEIKKIVVDGMLERMEQAFPGSSAKVTIAELGTPATQTRFVGNTGGAPFGLELRFTQSGLLRPRSHTPVSGLLLTGTSTAWGPGTVGSMISGVHAASAATGRDLASEIRGGTVLADPTRFSAWPDDFDPLAATRSFTVK
ncbi:phytoene desaturase family protein [Gordonia sp. CPCC 205333]|uniref:phytoene desaturase family protein n=1 Tax=Gordonia sp. CPCC 205333 TaxID=3140790 RepID=UPI003AF3F0AE